MKDPNNPCIFCNEKKNNIVDENDHAYASYDPYPVSKKHCLIVPKRHVKNYFDLSEKEILACNQLIKSMKIKIEEKDKSVKGFNIGTNSGKAAGQSIMHCHVHLIPRREGDVKNPQGGVRSVIPLKQYYVRKPWVVFWYQMSSINGWSIILCILDILQFFEILIILERQSK